jgi:CheY-like chemotaxis protein
MTIKKSMLIADSSPDALKAQSRGCGADGLNVVTSADGPQAMVLIAREPPDLAILDFDLPGADRVSIREQMARDGQTAAIPVIILSTRPSAEIESRCTAAGAHHVAKNSETLGNIRAIIQRELGAKSRANPFDAGTGVGSVPSTAAPPRPKILVVDDDANILEVFSIKLSIFGAEVVTATNGTKALTVATMETPDVIITDYSMPGGSGEYFVHHLRNDPILKDIPVIVLTGRTFQGAEDKALKRNFIGRYGAVGFLTKPVEEAQLLDELRNHITLPDS